MKRLLLAAAALLASATAVYAAAPDTVTSAYDAVACWFCNGGGC